MDEKNLNYVKDLMKSLAASDFVEFEYEQEGFKLRLVKAREVAPPPAVIVAAPVDAAGNRPVAAPPVAVETTGASYPAAVPAPAVDPDLGDIASPMVGTFYRAPNPNSDPFVEVGDSVKQGQVICIVEAMKLMNEIEADRDGEIVEIPVANGQPVEYGETLFRVRPPA